jgi:hypothetical protein
MNNILFIMFQGSGTNLKSWNEYTESKFLDQLKLIGKVYMHQDKTHNIWYYDKTNKEMKDFDSDININLSYVNPANYIKMIFSDIKKNHNLNEYKLIPVGWSAGCYLALYFAQIYIKLCKCVILLDSALLTPNNIKYRLKMLHNNIKNIYPLTDRKYKHILTKINNSEDIYKINYINNYIRTNFIFNNLNLKFFIPTFAFINIQEPEQDEWSDDFNNKRRLQEMNVLKRINPKYYVPYIMKNKTHYIFNKKSSSNKIIKIIKDFLS